MPLNQTTVAHIVDTSGSGEELVSDIIHRQISVSGKLEFGAYDQFHPDCVVTGSRVSRELLSELANCGKTEEQRQSNFRKVQGSPVAVSFPGPLVQSPCDGFAVRLGKVGAREPSPVTRRSFHANFDRLLGACRT